jgi:hypothetical protein
MKRDFNACFLNGVTGRCDFPVVPGTGYAQTYTYTLGLEVGPNDSRLRPYAGAAVGGVTYTYFAFDSRRSDTRRLWGLRGGLRVRAGRHAALIEARRATVSNPPWGLEALHPFELRAGAELTL